MVFFQLKFSESAPYRFESTSGLFIQYFLNVIYPLFLVSCYQKKTKPHRNAYLLHTGKSILLTGYIAKNCCEIFERHFSCSLSTSILCFEAIISLTGFINHTLIWKAPSQFYWAIMRSHFLLVYNIEHLINFGRTRTFCSTPDKM